MKELVAREIAQKVKDGEIIGVGTGSTVDIALDMIGERVRKEKLSLQVVPTSYESAWQCQELGLCVLSPGYRGELSWGFDGADEVNDRFWLIKGKGGALLKEKILAAKCKEYFVIVDESKIVNKLGAVCPVPVEVIPDALFVAERDLKKLGAKEITLRPCKGGKHGPIITEAGNIILDVLFDEITDNFDAKINSIVGVVENGLFMNYATEVLVGGEKGVRKLEKR